MIEEIKALKELLDIGAITQDEFDKKKAEILNAPALTGRGPDAQTETASQGISSKSKVIAGLLAIFLGGLGLHKFYLGYTTQGVIMLLVSLFGSLVFFLGPLVMGVIALTEGIIYLTKSDADFDAIYVQGKKEWF